MASEPQIVLVEDNDSDVAFVRESLRQAGLQLEVRVLINGEQALDLLSGIEHDQTAPLPALFILDLNLPRVSGSEVLRRVRESTRCSRVPVFVLTSSDTSQDKAEMARLGATLYLQKTSKLNEFMSLGAIVREHLQAERLRVDTPEPGTAACYHS